MIILKNISKSYGNTTILKDINLIINEGDYIAITGRSGSGKSTLLNIIGKTMTPSSGNFYYNNNDISLLSENEAANYRNKVIGFVFQSFHLELAYTAYQNIEIPLIIANVPKLERNIIINRLAKQLDIEGVLKKKTNDLSGGEKQRIAIARALTNNPKIILADEPTGNLDLENTKNILKIIKNLNEMGITIILVTHQITDTMDAKKIIYLEDGKIINEKNNL